MDKEGGIGTYSSPNESPDMVKEEKRGQVIGENPKAEVARFSSAEIGIKNLVFRTAVGVTRCVDTVAKTPGEEAI